MIGRLLRNIGVRRRCNFGVDAGTRAQTLSLAITTYMFETRIAEIAGVAAEDPRIREVVVADDGSGAEYCERLKQSLKAFGERAHLYCSDTNVGALRNKLRAVSRCSADWVVLLDSDNCLDEGYFDALDAERPWDPGTIYCPEFARPHFDYRPLAGTNIELATVGPLMRKHGERYVTTLLNTGNFLLPRDAYLEIVAPVRDVPVRGGDVLVAVYAWLSAGRRLRVVPGLAYDHLKRADGNFGRHARADKPLMKRLRANMAAGAPIDVQAFKSWRAEEPDHDR